MLITDESKRAALEEIGKFRTAPVTSGYYVQVAIEHAVAKATKEWIEAALAVRLSRADVDISTPAKYRTEELKAKAALLDRLESLENYRSLMDTACSIGTATERQIETSRSLTLQEIVTQQQREIETLTRYRAGMPAEQERIVNRLLELERQLENIRLSVQENIRPYEHTNPTH